VGYGTDMNNFGWLTSKNMFSFGWLKRDSSQTFLPEIDGLRFFAILPVMLMHFGTALLDENISFQRAEIDETSHLRQVMRNGGQGVQLFFSISGFILALPFINKNRSSLNFKSYYIRRLVRIEPPYIIAITGFLIVHIFLHDQSFGFLWERYLVSVPYLHNIIYQEPPYILPVAWSLEIEVQFYLLMPLFLYVLKVVDSRYWRYLLYGILFSISLNIDLLQSMDLNDYLIYFIPGIVAADLYQNKILKKHFLWNVVFVTSLISFYLMRDRLVQPILLFLIITSSLHLTFLRGVLRNDIIVIIGGMCYSLYLLHYPLYILFMKLFTNRITFADSFEVTYICQALIFVPLSILFITLFFMLVEKPFMVLSKKISAKK